MAGKKALSRIVGRIRSKMSKARVDKAGALQSKAFFDNREGKRIQALKARIKANKLILKNDDVGRGQRETLQKEIEKDKASIEDWKRRSRPTDRFERQKSIAKGADKVKSVKDKILYEGKSSSRLEDEARELSDKSHKKSMEKYNTQDKVKRAKIMKEAAKLRIKQGKKELKAASKELSEEKGKRPSRIPKIQRYSHLDEDKSIETKIASKIKKIKGRKFGADYIANVTKRSNGDLDLEVKLIGGERTRGWMDAYGKELGNMRITISKDGGKATTEVLKIHEKFQGHGLGKELARVGAKEARKYGVEKMKMLALNKRILDIVDKEGATTFKEDYKNKWTNKGFVQDRIGEGGSLGNPKGSVSAETDIRKRTQMKPYTDAAKQAAKWGGAAMGAGAATGAVIKGVQMLTEKDKKSVADKIKERKQIQVEKRAVQEKYGPGY
jgi:GNAT superfamily N-acetyltransferase